MMMTGSKETRAAPHRDPVAGRAALRDFLRPGCRDPLFVYESPDSLPSDNCLCWQEYETTGGAVLASLRYIVLSAAFGQPFSTPKILALRAFGARIHRSAYLAPQVFVDPLFAFLLTVGEGSILGLGTRIALHDHSGRRFRVGRVRIGRGVTIGADSRIAPGITVGDGAEVGSCSVVMRDVPPNAVVLGNPARLVNRAG